VGGLYLGFHQEDDDLSFTIVDEEGESFDIDEDQMEELLKTCLNSVQ
jgi:hypothetical protein